MKVALLIVFGLGVVAYVIFGLFRKERDGVTTKKEKQNKLKDVVTTPNDVVAAPKYVATAQKEGTCLQNDVCGVSCFCDEKSLERQMSEDIVYFEDEELDAFKGMAADAYTQEQIALFADVLTTLRPQEVADWLHSLQLREIALPDALKEEAIMMME